MADKEGIVKIHGKEYKTVALRVNEFREAHNTEFALVSEILQVDDAKVLMKATIFDIRGDVPKPVATGHAEEYRNASKINKTSALENAETSAFGRALACFGVGGTEFASANEVQNAIIKQETYASPDQVATIRSLLEAGTVTNEHLIKAFGTNNPNELLATEAARILSALKTAQQQAGA